MSMNIENENLQSTLHTIFPQPSDAEVTGERMLEFPVILDMLKEYTVTRAAREKFDRLRPILSETELQSKQQDTTDARELLDRQGNPPLAAADNMREIIENGRKGMMLSADELEEVRQFAVLSMRLLRYLNRGEDLDSNRVAAFGRGMQDLELLREEIELCIRNGRVDDEASPALRDARRKMAAVEAGIRSKLESLLRGRKDCFSESFISKRNGRYTLPVKKEYKSQIPGTVVDVSSSKATYFIEPAAVSRLREEQSELEIAESNEERKVLYRLTGSVLDYQEEILLNLDYVEALDYIFAKAKLSSDMGAVRPSFNRGRKVEIRAGRHPLLKREECVPLDICFGGSQRGVVITGPNTGGKTVALKTVGLLSIMAQCGLHVPCQRADLCMNSNVLCDIGDGQSISQNLSTFSAHISNIIEILRHVNEESLVLMDELGSGTDPSEGEGIAVAVLQELEERGCSFMATTHYSAVKGYAEKSTAIINARMAFDKESLRPLYRLEMGASGESCALYIAKRLGFPEKMLRRAYEAAYGAGPGEEESGKNETPESRILFDGAAKGLKASPGGKKRVVRRPEEKKTASAADQFEIGDSVTVLPEQVIGIVFQKADDRGEVGVQVKKKKLLVNYKRLKLKASAKDLYPPDYDFSIIFDTVENRKARHLMEKRHVEGNEIHYE